MDNILDILEAGAQLTDEQLDLLLSDEESLTAAEDIVLVQHVLAPKPSQEEVSARLRAFKQKHKKVFEQKQNKKERETKRAIPLLWLSLTGAAAAVAGLIWMIQKPGVSNDPSLLFEADNAVVATMTDDAGNALPLLSKDEGDVDSVISVSDYVDQYAHLEHDTLRLSLSQGQSYRVDLPDGSKVYLHPGSQLLYPTAFGSHYRDVRLKGEGYFIVAKDAERPFRVLTERSITSVLGTEFNLSSRSESEEKLVLVHGRVSFANMRNGAPVTVSPGQEVVLDDAGYLNLHPADTMQYTSWRDGFIYYDETTLDDILKQIGSTYNVSVHCYNRDLLRLRMHFVLRRDQNIEEAVRMLNSMKKVKASLRENKLIITEC